MKSINEIIDQYEGERDVQAQEIEKEKGSNRRLWDKNRAQSQEIENLKAWGANLINYVIDCDRQRDDILQEKLNEWELLTKDSEEDT